MHKIIYLDQNYISNLAKARAGLIKDSEETILWRELFDTLKVAVSVDKIVCPSSNFLRTDAIYDTRLEVSVQEIIDELSLDLQFCHWHDIFESQIEDAVKLFFDNRTSKTEGLINIFKSAPKITEQNLVRDVVDAGISTDISQPEEMAEHERKRKEEFVVIGRELNEDCGRKPMDWSRLVQESKKSTINGYMGVDAVQQNVSQMQSDTVLERMGGYADDARLSSLFDRLKESGLDSSDQNTLMKFCNSRELLNSPFIDIYSSLWAAIAECSRRQGGDIRNSDYYDVPILSMALPYCDSIATDGFMKETIVNLLHFNKKYKAEIFSGSKEDLITFKKYIDDLVL